MCETLDSDGASGHQLGAGYESVRPPLVPYPGVPQDHRHWVGTSDFDPVCEVDLLLHLDEVREEVEDVVEFFLKAGEVVALFVQGCLPGVGSQESPTVRPLPLKPRFSPRGRVFLYSHRSRSRWMNSRSVGLAAPPACSQQRSRWRRVELIRIGEPAPDFSLDSLQGKKVTLSLITPLWPVLIFFFRARCEACKVLMPELEDFQRFYGNADIEILAVSQDGKLTTGEFVESIRWPGRVLIDHPDLEVSKAYGVEYLPAGVLVGLDMKVKAVADSSDPTTFEALSRAAAAEVGWPHKPVFETGAPVVDPCPSRTLQPAS